jgi:hypothetical protein
MILFLIALVSSLSSVLFSYVKANYFIKAYYLLNGKEFKGLLIPFRSIGNFKEMFLLMPFLNYIYEENKRNIRAIKYIEQGTFYNKLSIACILVFVFFTILLAHSQGANIS